MQNQQDSRPPLPSAEEASTRQQENQTATFVISPENTPVKSQLEEENRQVISIEGNSSEENQGREEPEEGRAQGSPSEEVYETLYFQPPPSEHNSQEESEPSHQQELIEPPNQLQQSAELVEEQIEQHEREDEVEHVYGEEGIEQEWRDEEMVFDNSHSHLSGFTNEDYNFVGISNDGEVSHQNQPKEQREDAVVEPKVPSPQGNLPSSVQQSDIASNNQPEQVQTHKSSPQPQPPNQQPPPPPHNRPTASEVPPQQAPKISPRAEPQIRNETKPSAVIVERQQQARRNPPSPNPPKVQKVQKKEVVNTSEAPPKSSQVKTTIRKEPEPPSQKPKPVEKVLKPQTTPNAPPKVSVLPKPQPKKQVQKPVPPQRQEKKATAIEQPKPKSQAKKQQIPNRNLRLYYGLSQSNEGREKQVKTQQRRRQVERQQREQKEREEQQSTQPKKKSNVLALLANKPQVREQKQQQVPQKQEGEPPVRMAKKKKKKKKVAPSNQPKPKPNQSKEYILPNTDTSLTNFNQNRQTHNNNNPPPSQNDSNRDRHSVIDQARQPSQPSHPQERNMVNMINSELISSVYESKLPPQSSLTIVREAQKERVGTTYKMFLKYTFQYIRTIENYKRIVSDVSVELQKKKANKKYLQGVLEDYFEGFAKVNRDFNDQCYKFQVQSQMVSASNNPFANIRLQLKKGFDQMVYIRKSIANNSNRLNGYIHSTVLPAIKKAFQTYYSLLSQQEAKQSQRREEHMRKEKVFNRVMSQLDKQFHKGLEGKYKEDLFIEITKFINEEKVHRVSLRTYGRGVIDLRHNFIKCEKQLFDKLQEIVNGFKSQERAIYSNPREFSLLGEYTHQIKEGTRFNELCTLTDLDYIKYVLEIQNKKETSQFTSRHFESYLELVFFDRVVGNIRDMLKGATNKVFPMENPNDELIHSISGNLVLFSRDHDHCKDKYQIKNVNAKIVGAGFVEFDELLKGFIFDDSRTVRLRLRDEDRAEELICYLNEKEEDILLQHRGSMVH